MVFKRILHPVGQGAFFTEQFLDESGKVVYNVVYDCGSFTSQPNLLEYEIRNTFERNAHIDLLFISHFDEDHVNGLMTLQNQTKIDKDTKVIIPFKYPYLLMVMDDDYPTLARFVMRMFNIGAQVIGIEEISGENVRRDPIAIVAPMGNAPIETEKVIVDGWLMTGDLGYIDDDGFLFVTGRKNNLIVFENGEKLIPEQLEKELCEISEVIESMVTELRTAEKVLLNITVVSTKEKHSIESKVKQILEKAQLLSRLHIVNVTSESLEKSILGKVKRKNELMKEGNLKT